MSSNDLYKDKVTFSVSHEEGVILGDTKNLFTLVQSRILSLEC